MANILVTGGAGYIGSHTVKALAEAGHHPVVFDNFSRGNRWAVKWGSLVEGDLGDRAALVETLRAYRIESVLHFAAFAYVGESMRSPELYFENNVVKSLNLLEAMREAGAKRLIFSSTCATYGVPDALPITEQTSQRPINPYGETKLMIEQAMRWYGTVHGLQWTALRYFNACGADAGGQIGEAHDPETHLVPQVLDCAAGIRETITVFGTDYATRDGTCVRDYIHPTDLADAHVRALQFLSHGGLSQPFNLGTGIGHTVREILREVEMVSGLPVAIEVSGRRPGDPAVLVADAGRANAMLGWLPTHSSLRNMIETAWRWHQRTRKPDKEADFLSSAQHRWFPRVSSAVPLLQA